MLIQLLSDTHKSPFLIAPNVDLVIHAGDFANGDFNFLKQFKDACDAAGKQHLCVLGNHDFYFRTIEDAYDILDDLGINYLRDGKEFNFNGKIFVGGTLFTGFLLNGDDPLTVIKNKMLAQWNISDFKHVLNSNGNAYIKPNEYVELYNKHLDWINRYRHNPDVCVLTHFPPHPATIAPQYANDKLNPYYTNNINLAGFKHWLFGHCVDMVTEILTQTGWKHRPDLIIGDLVQTYNPSTGKFEFNPIEHITDVVYSGDVYHYTDNYVNQRVTDLHRMPVFDKDMTYTVMPAKDLFNVVEDYSFLISDHAGEAFGMLTCKNPPTVKQTLDENFWCITVKNSNFLMRRKGCVSLTGNTHTPFAGEVDGCKLQCAPIGYTHERDARALEENTTVEALSLTVFEIF
jgi:hypothetical protein